MADEDSFAAGGGDTSTLAPGKHRGPRFSWNSQSEATFFSSLVESVHLGLREGSTFKPEAWDRALTALIQKHNAYTANKGHLINKSDNARKKFRLWRGLREDPEFQYHRATRTVTATDDAWKRHIEREPLSRSLKGRPFEHEDYYEILFPDVIGSRGVPKRLTKPRRKGPDNVNGSEEQEAPGTGIMDLLADTSFANSSHGHMPQSLQPTPTPAPAPLPSAQSSMHHQQHQQHQPQQQLQQHQHQHQHQHQQQTHPHQHAQQTQQQAQQPQQQGQHPRANSTILPPRNTVPSSSALTPPEDPATHTRKRFQHPDTNGATHAPNQAEKRRRTTAAASASATATPASTYLDLTQQQQQAQAVQQPPPPPTQLPAGGPNGANNVAPAVQGQANSTAADSSMHQLMDALRHGTGRSAPSWQEQAMDIFFRDFSTEDKDLQLKIAEKALTDENKAMVFVKMPETLRKHWVKRLREVHNRIT